MPTYVESDPVKPISRSVYAADTRPGNVIPLPRNLKKQFYPPIMLLEALSRPTVLKRRSHGNTSGGDGYDPEQIFHHFVTSVALLFQVEPNGDAVSSCVVLQEPDKVEYVFSSNHRSRNELADVAQAVRDILKMVPLVDETNDKGGRGVRDKMLRAALALNSCRVKAYLSSLGPELRDCMASCERKGTERDRKLGLALSQIAVLAHTAAALEKIEERSARNPLTHATEAVIKEDRNPFTHATESVIKDLENLRRDSYLFSAIRQHVASEHKQANGTYWTEMCHISDRLKAYSTAIDAIFIARDNWPELFDDFEIRFVPSSSVASNPLSSNPKKAVELLIVSIADKVLRPRLQAEVAELQQKHGIDEMIEDAWKEGLNPVVHAEVQLHSWLESSGGTRPERFFGRYKFIGNSKPTCKLCSYYFDEHGTDVTVRPSHRNLYTSWRMPDLLDHQGPDGENRRMLLMHKIKKRVVADIERSIGEKRADYRPHDSTDQKGRDVGSLISTSIADTLSLRMDDLSIVGESDGPSDPNVDTIIFPGRRGLALARRP